VYSFSVVCSPTVVITVFAKPMALVMVILDALHDFENKLI